MLATPSPLIALTGNARMRTSWSFPIMLLLRITSPIGFGNKTGGMLPSRPVVDHLFMVSKNSPLVLVARSLSTMNSIASMVPIGLRTRRSM
jgi:hypothetical protein